MPSACAFSWIPAATPTRRCARISTTSSASASVSRPKDLPLCSTSTTATRGPTLPPSGRRRPGSRWATRSCRRRYITIRRSACRSWWRLVPRPTSSRRATRSPTGCSGASKARPTTAATATRRLPTGTALSPCSNRPRKPVARCARKPRSSSTPSALATLLRWSSTSINSRISISMSSVSPTILSGTRACRNCRNRSTNWPPSIPRRRCRSWRRPTTTSGNHRRARASTTTSLPPGPSHLPDRRPLQRLSSTS